MSFSAKVLSERPLQLSPPGSYDGNMITDVMSCVCDTPGAQVVLPQGQTVQGAVFYIESPASSTAPFSVQSASNKPVAIVSPGELWVFVNRDGAESWMAQKVTGQHPGSTAPALAGYGLCVSRAGTLDVVYSSVQVLQEAMAPFVVTEALQQGLLVCAGGSQIIQIPSPFRAGFSFSVSALASASLVTVQGLDTSARTILVNQQTTFVVWPGTAVTFVSDGQNFWVQAGNTSFSEGQVPSVYSVDILPGQTVIVLPAVALKSSVLSFNTSPQNGANSVLFDNCQVFTGTTQGVWDVTFLTNPNTLGNVLTFSAGTPSSPSLGQSWSGNANASFSVRLCVQNDPTGTLLGVYPVGSWNPGLV